MDVAVLAEFERKMAIRNRGIEAAGQLLSIATSCALIAALIVGNGTNRAGYVVVALLLTVAVLWGLIAAAVFDDVYLETHQAHELLVPTSKRSL